MVIFAVDKSISHMNRKMILFVGMLSVIVLASGLAGLLLPKEREFVKEAVINHPVGQVFSTVTDINNQLAWRPEVKEINIIDEETWTEVMQKGTPLTFKIRRKVQDSLFEIEIIEPKSFNGYWVGTFEPFGDIGTKITFKEVIRIENPYFRLLSFIFIDLDNHMNEYLSNLTTHLGK